MVPTRQNGGCAASTTANNNKLVISTASRCARRVLCLVTAAFLLTHHGAPASATPSRHSQPDTTHRVGDVGDNDTGAVGDTWVVIVSTSIFWYNYRHTVNAMAVYRTVKRLGIPDDRIVLMLAEGFACDSRNPLPPSLFTSSRLDDDVYADRVEVDYRGPDVTPASFLAVLSGRHPDALNVPLARQLRSDSNSRVLVYATGHGGENFFKFRDSEVISSRDISDTVAHMHRQGRYGELLVIIDTCHAESLLVGIDSPNVVAIGSSSRHEDSVSIELSKYLGVYTIDAFTKRLVGFLDRLPGGDSTLDRRDTGTNPTLTDLFDHVRDRRIVRSQAVMHTTLPWDVVSRMRVCDFVSPRRPTVEFTVYNDPARREPLQGNLDDGDGDGQVPATLLPSQATTATTVQGNDGSSCTERSSDRDNDDCCDTQGGGTETAATSNPPQPVPMQTGTNRRPLRDISHNAPPPPFVVAPGFLVAAGVVAAGLVALVLESVGITVLPLAGARGVNTSWKRL